MNTAQPSDAGLLEEVPLKMKFGKSGAVYDSLMFEGPFMKIVSMIPITDNTQICSTRDGKIFLKQGHHYYTVEGFINLVKNNPNFFTRSDWKSYIRVSNYGTPTKWDNSVIEYLNIAKVLLGDNADNFATREEIDSATSDADRIGEFPKDYRGDICHRRELSYFKNLLSESVTKLINNERGAKV